MNWRFAKVFLLIGVLGQLAYFVAWVSKDAETSNLSSDPVKKSGASQLPVSLSALSEARFL
jgi:hypothetical protein